MTVRIQGKEYVTVAERVQAFLNSSQELVKSIRTEVLQHTPRVVIKATITLGEDEFTGISAADPEKAMEKKSPYEVAETSAVGRALGFAGFGSTDSIASADEIINAGGEKRTLPDEEDIF